MSNSNDSHYDKDIIFVKNNVHFTINYHDIDAIKNIIPKNKIHINELSKYTKIFTDLGYKCYYIGERSKI